MNTFKKQLGQQGILGLILLLCAAIFNQVLLAPLEKQTAQIYERLDKQISKSAKHTNQPSATTLLNSLPNDQEALDVLAKIYLLAEATGVSYKQAEYHLETKPRREYRISFPVEGEYKNLRYFVARILSEQPAVSLDQISFEREKVSDAVLQANIRLTIFLRP